MGILNINDLKEGMTLAADVKNKHGIPDADVEGADRDQLHQEEMKTVSPEVIAVIEKELNEIFPPVDGNELMSEIYRIVKKLKIRQVVES